MTFLLRGKGCLSCLFFFYRLSHEVNAGHPSAGLLGIHFPAETIAAFSAQFFRFHGTALPGMQLAELHGMEDLHAIERRENIADRFADQVLGAMTELREKRLVA